MPAEVTRRWSAREVRQLIADTPLATPRYELVDGELLVTPSPGFPHQVAVRDLILTLAQYLEREPVGHVLHSPSDVELEPEDVRQPDVFVAPSAEWKRVARERFPVRKLLVAIEVLSPSSAHYDRVRKRPGYQRHVSEYWIVDLEARVIERWRAGDERPTVLTDRLIWHAPGAHSAFELEVAGFFRRAFAED